MADDTQEEGADEGFKIRDKRRFDEEGNPRSANDSVSSDQRAESSGAGATSPELESEGNDQPESGAIGDSSSGGELPQLDFSGFVMSLGTQALIQLGEVQPPHGMAVEVDVDAAKQTIDILAMIEGKTQGNLDDSEQKLLEGMLHNLRLSYVAKNK